MTVVGVDISTYAVHTAWLENGTPKRWHCDLGKPKDNITDRVRRVHMTWPASVEEIVVEYPFGRSREGTGSLMAVVGAVTKSAPSYTRVTWEPSRVLRAAIGAANTKISAHGALMNVDVVPQWGQLVYWTPDELDALVACIGWTRILEAQA